MASLNVNGFRSNPDEFKVLMNEMDIDLLALNETKLDSSFSNDSTEIAGYNQQRLDRSCFGRGVSIYVRETIRVLIRNVPPVKIWKCYVLESTIKV